MPPRKTQKSSASNAALVERASEFFLSSIRDPHNVRHCGTCLDGALAVSTRVERQAFESKVQDRVKPATAKADPKLYNATLAFLLIKRSDKQMQRLLARLSECHCEMDDLAGTVKWYHEVGKEKEAALLARGFLEEDDPPEVQDGGDQAIARRTSIKAKCVFLVHFLWVLHVPLGLGGIKTIAKGASSFWPVASTDLLPFGADNFVQSMHQWYRFIPDPIVFRFMALVLRVCQSLVIPSLIKYKFTDMFVQSTRSMVDLTMAELCLPKPPSHLIVRRFDAHLADLLPCLKITIYKVSQDCRGALFRGCETKAMQLCSVLLYLLVRLTPYSKQDSNPAMTYELAMDGYELFRFFHMHLPPRPSMLVYPTVEEVDSRVFPPPASIREPKEATIFYISTFRSDTQCSAQDCLNSMQSVGKDFQRCGRCGVVSYCGRDCQTKAWKEEQYPHKRLCPVLRNLMALGGGAELFFEAKGVNGNIRETKRIVLENWRNARVDEKDFELVVDWGKWIGESKAYPMPDGTEWNPGYEDYDELIATLSANGRGPIPRYMNRLARWPSEVAKELRMLKLLPFCELDNFSEI